MLGNTGARGRGDMFTTAEEKDMLLRQCKRTKRKDGLSVLQDKLYDGKLRELEIVEEGPKAAVASWPILSSTSASTIQSLGTLQ
ncbi:hypothetical protein Tco_0556272 [Tanacetum coccineum]